MKLPRELPTPGYWSYVDELDGRGLDLSYPREVIKGIKRQCIAGTIDWDDLSKDMIVFINKPQDNVPYEVKITPNAAKAIKQKLKYKYGSINIGVNDRIPKTVDILNELLDMDKYFSMCITLKRELPTIVNNIHYHHNYKYAAINIAALTSTYNMEIVKLINDYLSTHKFFDKSTGRWCGYIIVNNRSFIISNEAYVAVLIYKYYYNHGVSEEHADLIYENYDVLVSPDKDHQIKRGNGKSFLQDCKKVALIKKELTHSTIGIIEFHDLIRYGGYNDKILSIDTMNAISDIFGHRKWIHQFFVALSLYCDNYLNIDELKEDIKNESTSLIDPSKIKDFDLFIKVVDYLDSIYDTLIANPDLK